jgi:hypothetical protein
LAGIGDPLGGGIVVHEIFGVGDVGGGGD